MTNLFLILDVFEEVPQFKATVLPEVEAEEYVRNYCEEENIDYKGLDYFQYYPSHYNSCQVFLQVAPVHPDTGDVKLGFYWPTKEETKLTDVYSNDKR